MSWVVMWFLAIDLKLWGKPVPRQKVGAGAPVVVRDIGEDWEDQIQ